MITQPTAPSDFDFMIGEWRVNHRRLNSRLTGCTDWTEFKGTSSTRTILGGFGNVEDNILMFPEGEVSAAAFRSFNEPRRIGQSGGLTIARLTGSMFQSWASFPDQLAHFSHKTPWRESQSPSALLGTRISGAIQRGSRLSQAMAATPGRPIGSWSLCAVRPNPSLKRSAKSGTRLNSGVERLLPRKLTGNNGTIWRLI